MDNQPKMPTLSSSTVQEYKSPKHWSVTVSVGSHAIVTIEPTMLSGVPCPDEDAIRTAAHHLLAFIGDPLPPM